MEDPARLVVLISGSGTNLQAILDACAGGSLNAEVAAVISNKADAFGLIRARKAGIPDLFLPQQPGEPRGEYDARLALMAREYEPDWIVLAGWMRILTMPFLECFPGRVINLHPALPGTFPGTHAIERAYDAWKSGRIEKTGVMVHLVPDEGVDIGPVLGIQEIVFTPGESLEEFEQRVHYAEHKLLVSVLADLAANPPSK